MWIGTGRDVSSLKAYGVVLFTAERQSTSNSSVIRGLRMKLGNVKLVLFDSAWKIQPLYRIC